MIHRALFTLTLVLALEPHASAFPEYLQNFRTDAFRKPDVDGCTVCHMSPDGGDERNPFGKAFESSNFVFTPLLRSQFPDRFAYPVSKIGDAVVVHFSDPNNRQVVIETNGKKSLVDLEKRTVTDPSMPAPAPAEEPGAPSPPAQAGARLVRSRDGGVFDAMAREGAIFGMHVVNLPNGKPMRAGGADFWVAHRFTFPVFDEGSFSNLFGFDSAAVIGFGVRAGITDRISVSVFRSNNFQTLELGSAVQIARQDHETPLTLQLRAGVEGRKNFRERYSPGLQIVAAHNFGGRLSLVAVPAISFNTRDEKTFLPPEFLFGEEDNYTATLGLGAGVRVLPSLSLVGEYIPRVNGFKGEITDRPAVSFGFQKATYRHTFQAVFTTAQALATTQYSVNGTDKFRIGFNIYRQLR